MKHVWVVSDGVYYNDISSVEAVFKTKHDAEKQLRREGFKHSSRQALWLDGSHWRRLEKVLFIAPPEE